MHCYSLFCAHHQQRATWTSDGRVKPSFEGWTCGWHESGFRIGQEDARQVCVCKQMMDKAYAANNRSREDDRRLECSVTVQKAVQSCKHAHCGKVCCAAVNSLAQRAASHLSTVSNQSQVVGLGLTPNPTTQNLIGTGNIV